MLDIISPNAATLVQIVSTLLTVPPTYHIELIEAPSLNTSSITQQFILAHQSNNHTISVQLLHPNNDMVHIMI
jgi:hypothetical protein